ncbi:branched-chain amino acid aminotransferase/4-amino-4-deoxychorismate lyase [Desulfitobacterium dehalogenans ATCC 51507]|uniref:Branched-chain amino acid aminotransferase/4-amino-4-deoxychorismate lyase n=1 Tax=Desulfitobacterium dehalogenans (strain ATCC 51507 / DSM 9161 / JW/IU-DC1) TaxID=756499 RepID=I4ADQ4_DESDJ|nr:aminotransferase class IV [Desulfitobacterium dehalogenans]AFM02089.1 branched-chain amino acid aminotransferase/4-amino-4-deoxychorismate lyase [Desulfitobacterium dehalogenans ATCC 51507]
MLDKDDRLALFGYGIFETLRVDGPHIEVPRLHYERMSRGAEQLGLSMPGYEVWLAGLEENVQKNTRIAGTTFALRVTLSGGAGQEVPPRWLYHTRPLPYTERDYDEGIPITILSHPCNEYSPLVQLKSTNYMENILAKKEAEEKGAREGIWLNTKGYLAEGTMSNLFFIREGILHTPSPDCGCLPGTRRQMILECAQTLGIPCVEGEFPLEFLEDAEEVFLTNALMGIMPVNQVDKRRLPLKNSVEESLRMRIGEFYQEIRYEYRV